MQAEYQLNILKKNTIAKLLVFVSDNNCCLLKGGDNMTSELIKALMQRNDELESENKILKESCENFASVEQNLHEKIDMLQMDKNQLEERILDLEACE